MSPEQKDKYLKVLERLKNKVEEMSEEELIEFILNEGIMGYKVGQVWTDPNNEEVTMEIIKIEADGNPPRIVVKITYEDEEGPCTDIGYFGMQGNGWDFYGHYNLSVLKTD